MASVKKVRNAESRTETLLHDLLKTQGWDVRKPPRGEVLVKQEYKEIAEFGGLFRSKSGRGDGFPEALIIDRNKTLPLAVIEAKAHVDNIDQALDEAQFYAENCFIKGYHPIAIGIAGNEDDFTIKVSCWDGKSWKNVQYQGSPITWIPSANDIAIIESIRLTNQELRPSVPSPLVLQLRADEINRLLREARLKDEFRPSAVAAMMLGLWESRGKIRRDTDFVLSDINLACRRAFNKAGKPDLANSLRVDEANSKLAEKAVVILSILTKLNVTNLTAEHDYLGQLYEAFFRYTGGNTIGQYFTPRHIAQLAAELTEVKSTDIVLDPACGTGGFLIASMERAAREEKLTRSQIVNIVKNMLIGYETEPVTAALCVANMILRGDGTSGIRQEDSLSAQDFPIGKVQIVLMNPPFLHKKTDTPIETFIERGLESLQSRGLMAVILPNSMLSKKSYHDWRKKIEKDNTIKAVIRLPNEIFQPYAAATTSLVLIQKGSPNRGATFFGNINNDGFRLKKGVRQPTSGDQIPSMIDSFLSATTQHGLSSFAKIDNNRGWSAGVYVEAILPDTTEIKESTSLLLSLNTSFTIKFLGKIKQMLDDIDSEEIELIDYSRIKKNIRSMVRDTVAKPSTIGAYFEIFYGQKDLHDKSYLVKGSKLIISSSSMDNGCYGFFQYTKLIKPPFITVPSTGSIGFSHVQLYPCGVTDDCLILVPRNGVSMSKLYIAASIIRRERWRFDYGNKITPERIMDLPMLIDEDLENWLQAEIEKHDSISTFASDKLDSQSIDIDL